MFFTNKYFPDLNNRNSFLCIILMHSHGLLLFFFFAFLLPLGQLLLEPLFSSVHFLKPNCRRTLFLPLPFFFLFMVHCFSLPILIWIDSSCSIFTCFLVIIHIFRRDSWRLSSSSVHAHRTPPLEWERWFGFANKKIVCLF